jgi:site-specific DNA-methyltransferase (adenine-specific)
VGLYLYDRRVWVKDAAWENSRWHTMSYRAVDEFEYVYIFWKPGQTKVDKDRLTKDQWIEWGSRAVWSIPSVRANDDHEAKFPIELPKRLIQLLTDPSDIVLDCFAGSGTSAVAAILSGRRFIGVEFLPKYVELASRALRIAQTKPVQFSLIDNGIYPAA